ncbi:unnamed protein product, partial [Vitis vinifera]
MQLSKTKLHTAMDCPPTTLLSNITNCCIYPSKETYQYKQTALNKLEIIQVI